jgi:hypothetical protein
MKENKSEKSLNPKVLKERKEKEKKKLLIDDSNNNTLDPIKIVNKPKHIQPLYLLLFLLVISYLYNRIKHNYGKRFKNNCRKISHSSSSLQDNSLLPDPSPFQNFQDSQEVSEENNNYFEDSPYGVYYNDSLHLNYFATQ